MNKLYKILLGVFIIGIGIVNTTNATIIKDNINYLLTGDIVPGPYTSSNQYLVLFNLGQVFDNNTVPQSTYCIRFTADGVSTNTAYRFGFSSNTVQTNAPNIMLQQYGSQFGEWTCTVANRPYLLGHNEFSGLNLHYEIFDLNTLLNKDITCPTCPTCEEQYTSLECQTEYNLIPINDVNENYCKLNFDLIAPTECPNIGEGTGEINWTARYINNQQYPGTASLRINIEDFLQRQTTYNEEETIVDVIGYNADETYIDNIINNTQTGATPQDFENLIYTLTGFIPYVLMMILLTFIIWLIKKLFKS